MKTARNVPFVVVGLVWLFFIAPVAHAVDGQACTVPACDWGPNWCCNVGTGLETLDCGDEGHGVGVCHYCYEMSGQKTDTACWADVEGEQVSGFVCQCEGPINGRHQ